MPKFNDMNDSTLEKAIRKALNAGTKDMVKDLKESKEKLWEDYVKDTKDTREGLIEVLTQASDDFEITTEDGKDIDIVKEFKSLLTDTFQFGCEIGSYNGGVAMNSTWVKTVPELIVSLIKENEDVLNALSAEEDEDEDKKEKRNKSKVGVDPNDEDAGGEAFDMMSDAMTKLKDDLNNKFGKKAADTFLTAFILAAARKITLNDKKAERAFEKAKDLDFS